MPKLGKSLDANNLGIINLSAPSAGHHAANKAYVDGLIHGLDPKGSCRARTAAALEAYTVSGGGTILTANANGSFAARDGITLTVGQRLLVANEPNGGGLDANNGIYQVTQVGSGGTPWILTRTLDADTWDELVGAYTFVEEGTIYADTGWLLSVNAGGTLGTSPVTVVNFAGPGTLNPGDGIDISLGVVSVKVDATSIQFNGSDEIEVVPGLYARKYSTTNPGGDGPNTVTHNLNNTGVEVTVRETATGIHVLANVVVVNANSVTVAYEGAPAAGFYTISVQG